MCRFGVPPTRSAEERLERELTKTIQAAAAQYLSKYEFDVQIVDVAMAGREAFEKPGFNSDLRIRNQMGKPPKISVQYEIKDPSGHIVAKGARVLTDLNYQFDHANSEIDTLYPEKQLLRHWIRDCHANWANSSAPPVSTASGSEREAQTEPRRHEVVLRLVYKLISEV